MRLTIASCVAAAFVLAGAPGRAATHVWNPAVTTGNWSAAGSWSSGGVPTSGEGGGTIVQIGGGVTATDDIAGLVIDRLVSSSHGHTVNGGITLGINGALLFPNLQNVTGSNTPGASLAIPL